VVLLFTVQTLKQAIFTSFSKVGKWLWAHPASLA